MDTGHEAVEGTVGIDVIEVHLEELGQHSWLKALFTSASGSYGSAQFRFVAVTGGEHDPAEHVAVGATFPMMRWQDLNDLTEPNAWLDIARERLRELDRELTGQGWRRLPERGKHWWTLRYSR